MASISGRPDPNRLDAVIDHDHLVLGALLVELARCPATPGVMADLTATMAHCERVHMAVVEHVLFPVLTGGGEQAVVDRALAGHERIRGDLDDLACCEQARRPDAVHRLVEDMADQFAFESGVLVPAVEHLPTADPGHVGHRMSKLTDAGLSSSAFRSGVAR